MAVHLDTIWTELGARMGPQGPASFAGLKEESIAAREGVGLFDQSAWGRVRFSGKDAADLLHRLTTNHVSRLKPFQGNASAAVTAKGRMISAGELVRLEDGLWYITHPGQDISYRDLIDRFVFREEVEIAVETGHTALLLLTGAGALGLVHQLCGADVGALPRHHAATAAIAGAPVVLIRTWGFGGDGVRILTPALEQAAGVARALLSAGAIACGVETHELLRIESGFPAPGHELTEEYNPHELEMAEYISWDKGCYTGQEVIARLDTYDKVQRHLVHVSGPEHIRPGAPLIHDDLEVGRITSAARRPDGQMIGLAVLKTRTLPENAQIRVSGDGGEAAISWKQVKFTSN
ncbi:MAG: Aminomethyltransferase [Myxococcota bacterium]|nr:Aminomethyltransferase [Myxococcota bacterium]